MVASTVVWFLVVRRETLTFQNQAAGIGGYFSATPTQLLFDFSNGAGSYFQGAPGEPGNLTTGPQNPQFVWCLQAAANVCVDGDGSEEAISVDGPAIGDNQFVLVSGTQVIGTAGVTLSGLQGGSSSAPVTLLSTQPVGQVTGTIGGLGSQDFYSFQWTGGAFSATAEIAGANAGASYLFSEGAIGGGCSSGGSATLNSGDNFANAIDVANLPAGQYCIGVDANSSVDPPLSLIFNTPVNGFQPTPEPASSILLLTAGVGFLGARRLIRKHSR